MTDNKVNGNHCYHKGNQTAPVKIFFFVSYDFAFGGSTNKEVADDGYDDGEPKNPAPANGRSYEATKEGAKATATPRTYGPKANCTLTGGTVVVGFDKCQGTGHNAGGGKTLDNSACQQIVDGTSRSHGNQKRADDTEEGT